MSVTIEDILELKLFKDATVISGARGLNNKVKRVNFSDCPILDDELDSSLVNKGDIFINSFYIIKGDTTKLYNAISYYIKSDSAGVFITDEYLKMIPAEVIELSNSCNLPIIGISRELPYAEIVKNIMEVILLDQSDVIGEMKIDRLIDKNIRRSEVIESARHINGKFEKKYLSLFFTLPSLDESKFNSLRNVIGNNNKLEIIKYKNDFMVILNFNEEKERVSILEYLNSLLNSYDKDYKVGISNIFSEVEEFHLSVRQARSSFEMAHIISDNVVYYKTLNVYKLLYPLKDTEYIRDFYNEIAMPIKEYDEASNSDLFTTVSNFLENDCDYKKTAQVLYQHENTIRYRVAKAKKLLNLEDDTTKFIEQMSLAVKINRILNGNKN